MRSVSVRLADLDRVKINLGIAGENEHTHVLFDCKKAFDQYPNATPFLIVTPPRGDIYPAVVTRDGDIVEWVVTDSDLIYHGNGKVQLQFKQGDIIMKSYEARTSIAISSEPTGTVPTPIQNWITQANAILASIPDDIAAALAEAKASGQFDGADGVGIASITLKSTVGLVDTYTITLTDGRDYDFTVTNGTPGQNGVGIQSIAKTSTVGLVDTYTVTLTNGQTYPFTVTNGQNGVEIDDNTPANNKVFSSAKVDLELTDVKTAIQGLDDEKYEKPSGGIPATDLTQAVQNSLGAANSAYQKPSGGIPASDIADGVIPVVDSALSYSSENAVQNKVVKGALDTKAPVIINTATGNPAVFNDGGGMPLKSLLIPFTPVQSGTGNPSPQNIRNILPWNGLTVYQSGADTSNPTETDISFPSPVYGGTLDAVTGVLTVEWAGFSATWGDGESATDMGEGITRKVFPMVDYLQTGLTNNMCNIAPYQASEQAIIHFYYSGSGATNRKCRLFLPSDTPDSTEVTVITKLSQIYEIQLTPQEITALVGDNTIWSDADGSMIVEYPADTALFIANQHRNFIAPELSSMIADTALVKNDFRIVGNNLYKITTAIASGGTLTPNTNCVKTTLAEVIKPLLT